MNRTLDTLYALFFHLHVPVMLMVDLCPLYPRMLQPAFLTDIRTWYVATYKDRFFLETTTSSSQNVLTSPAWFRLFLWMEALVHLPISIWMILRWWQKDRFLQAHHHLVLLLFALQTVLTTAVCVVEYRSWPELSPHERSKLGGLYLPYLMFAMLLFGDMLLRVWRALLPREASRTS